MSGRTLPDTSKRSAFGPARSTCTPSSAGSSGTAPLKVTSTVWAPVRWRSSSQRPLVHQPALAQDPDPVAQGLDLAQDVGREEDRLAALLGLAGGVAEGDLHQRVEPARRLVEQQQVGPGREGRDQLHLLAVALREGPDLLAGVELEAVHELVAVGAVDAAAQPGQELQGLGAGHRGPQERLAGHVGHPPVGRHRVAPGVDAEQRGAAAARPVQPEQEPDRGRLAGPVRSEVAVGLARLDRQVQPVEGDGVAVALAEVGRDDCAHRSATVL